MDRTTETTPGSVSRATEGLAHLPERPERGLAPMVATSALFIPIDRSTRPQCGARSPRLNACNRHPGHGGRHLFAHRHLDGRVREVWS